VQRTAGFALCRGLAALAPPPLTRDVMSEREIAAWPVRVVVSVTMGCALVTAWLQPLYQMFIVRGGVLVPR